MRAPALGVLVVRELFRTRGALATSGFGIAAGTAALVFFLALGLGVRAVLLGDVFPVDQVELEPPKGDDPGLLGLVLGAGAAPGIDPDAVATLKSTPGVIGVYPKLRFAFPASARGGAKQLGRDVGTSELVGDGIEAGLVAGELPSGAPPFDDPLTRATKPCKTTEDCSGEQYCEKPPSAPEGRCSEPVPVLVSRYLVEVFDKSLAPAHGLPPIGDTLVKKAEGVVFTMRIGESLLGKAKGAEPRVVHARIVGVSRRAIDLGVTLPIDVVRRLNREFAGSAAATRYSSVIVEVADGADTARVIEKGATMKLEPKDTRARDVSVLTAGVMALLSLVSTVILVVSATNIAHTFRVFVSERSAEIALYRALGATQTDMRAWVLALATFVGAAGAAAGIVVARLGASAADAVAAEHLPDFPFKPSTFFSFPVWLYGAALAFGALFAVAGAIAPAIRASRVDPVRALAERS
ncbi:MAG: ABC transporter permease [Myxococcales bacterium]|nr:ABC transporter permease [Myxococcales bacterium]